MGWATKTNCDTPRPILGNPASLVPPVYRPPALSAQALADFYNNAPISAPTPNPVMPPAPIIAEAAVVPCPSPAPQPESDAAAVNTTAPQPTTPPATLSAEPTITFSQLVSSLCPTHLTLALPRLRPVGTLLLEPDNSLSGGINRADPPSRRPAKRSSSYRSTARTTFSTVLQLRDPAACFRLLRPDNRLFFPVQDGSLSTEFPLPENCVLIRHIRQTDITRRSRTLPSLSTQHFFPIFTKDEALSTVSA